MTKFLVDSQFTLDGIRRTKDGYLAAYANVARTGVQKYRGSELGRPDLDVVNVYRPPEEVFHRDALKSMAHRPVTLNHPSEVVDSANWKKYAKGHTGDEILRDGDHVRVPMVLMDAETIKAVENGTRELSMGYSTELKWTPGITEDGERYDAIQTEIRANHLALVPVARGGSRLRFGDGDWDESKHPRGKGGLWISSSGTESNLKKLGYGTEKIKSTKPAWYLSGEGEQNAVVEEPDGSLTYYGGVGEGWGSGDWSPDKPGSKVSEDLTTGQYGFKRNLKPEQFQAFTEMISDPDYSGDPEKDEIVNRKKQTKDGLVFEYTGNLGKHGISVGRTTTNDANSVPTKGKTMKTILIDGAPIEFADALAASIVENKLKALTDAWTDMKKKADEEEENAKKSKAACDAAMGEVAVLKKQVADAAITPEKLDAMVEERKSVVDAAAAFLPKDFAVSGKTLPEIRRAAVAVHLGDAAKDMSDDAVAGAFRMMTADGQKKGGTAALASAFSQRQVTVGDTAIQDKAYDEYKKNLSDGWKVKASA